MESKARVKWLGLAEGLREALTEMCARVGCTPEDVDWEDAQWYQSQSWTEQAQWDYRMWLAEKLVERQDLRNSLMKSSTRRRRTCEAAADEFIFQWGWTTGDAQIGTKAKAPEVTENLHGLTESEGVEEPKPVRKVKGKPKAKEE